ncbi:MAG TPA: hypothetical protein VMD31_09275 [Opitutaceae bacterium]|nr:hypothetical protein [Opitutaceae bacterium]
MHPLRRGRVWRPRLVVAIVLAALTAFYFWTVAGEERVELAGPKHDYYNLLVHGMLKGHLYLDVPVPPELTRLADPYDPAKNAQWGMHDVSYYQGHFYLYFGVTPALLLFLPYHVLTGGSDLPQFLGNAMFCAVGLLAVAAILIDLRRTYFPRGGTGMLVLCLLTAGLGSFTLATMSRSSFWELPIAAGYGCAMVSLWGVYRALHRRHPAGWLVLAGLAFGLAVGARPVYAPAGVALLVPLLALWRRGRRAGRWRVWPCRDWWAQAMALLAPVALCALGLALYNYGRFGNPLDFGLRYQMTGGDQLHSKLFSVSYLPFNWRVYFLEPAHWSRYFPFLQVPAVPPRPPGYYSTEFVYGLLTDLPAVWLVVPALVGVCGWKRGRWPELAAFVATVALWAGVTVGVLMCFNTAAARYMADFTPALMLVGLVGALGGAHFCARLPRWAAAAARTALAAALAFTAFFGLMAGFQLHGLLRIQRPAAYADLERIFNQPVYWLDRLAGTPFGPVEIKLRLPKGRVGRFEPLVVTGWAYEADFAFFYYPDATHLQVGFDHTSHGTVVGAPFEVDYDKDHTVDVELGSLYPPATHPFFAGMTPAAIDAYRQYCRVTFDGQVVLELTSAFYDSSPGRIGIGVNPVSPAYGREFTGKILAVRRLPPPDRSALESLGQYQHPLRLKVKFPETLSPFPLREPILVSGRTGRGNALYVEYLGGNQIRFGFDQWGVRSYQSAPTTLDLSRVHVLEIDCGVLHPSHDKPGTIRHAPLVIGIDGREVWRATLPYYTCPAASIVIGRNAIDSSTCGMQFTGGLLVPLPADPAPAP